MPAAEVDITADLVRALLAGRHPDLAALPVRFLAALHAPAPPDAPANPFRGIPLRGRSESFEASLEILSGQVDTDAVRLVWDDALAAPEHDGPPLWLHGDLHPANILIQDGAVSGVIDFGDITAGDPACDLSVVWMLLPARCHGQFWEAYGGIDESLLSRARGWALALAVVFLAHSAGSPWLVRVGSETLKALVRSG